MDEQVSKRISDAVTDGSDELDDDLEQLLKKEDYLKYYKQVKTIETWLRAWPHEEPPSQFWDDFSSRLTERLDTFTPDENEEDPLAPPAPDPKEEKTEKPDETEAESADEEKGEQAESADEEKEEQTEGADKEESKKVNPLAALAGRSTLPPEKPLAAQPEESSDDSDDVIDLGALKEASEKPEEKKLGIPAQVAPAIALSSAESRVALASPSTAASKPQEKQSNSTAYVIGFLVVALLAVTYFSFGRGDDETMASRGERSGALASQSAVEPPSLEPERRIAAGEGQPSTNSDLGGTAEEAVEEGEQAVAEENVEEAEPEDQGESSAASNGSSRRRSTSKRERSTSTESAPIEAEARVSKASASTAPAKRAAATPPPTKAANGTSSLDALLAGATKRQKGKAGTSAAVEAVTGSGGGEASSSLPVQPSRAQVRRAMGSVASQVMACRSMVNAQTRVNATVNVASAGNVTSASVSGGTPAVQQCVRRAITRARFPRFSRATFTVTYPYILSPP